MDENEDALTQSVDQRGLNMDSTPYEYNILQKDSIRVISLLPGNRSAPLQCELHRADVPGLSSPGRASDPTFEALSYTWGDPNLCQRLFCNNSAIKITQSLFDALTHLRHAKATRTLWVDAVCINQNNDDEKIEQLPHMKKIYQHASHVVIWLGLADESTSRALDLFQLAANCLRQESKLSMPANDLVLFKEPFSDEKNKQWGFPSGEDLESWLPVAELYARSWFYRCWTFQEAVLATKATIQIGAHLLDWADFCVASNFFLFKFYGFKFRAIRIQLVNVVKLCSATKIGRGWQEWVPMPLMHLLSVTIHTQATLPKDKIFGLLALARDSAQKYFLPGGPVNNSKYNMSIRELYTDASRFLLHESAEGYIYPLELLTNVKHYPLEEGEQEKRNEDDGGLIPSWVKRWHDPIRQSNVNRQENEVQPMYVISYLPYAKSFYTGGREYHGPECHPQTPYEISLHGFLFATISNTVNFLRLPPLTRSRLWDMVLEIRSVREERHAPYPTGESIDEAFALTLTLANEPQSTHGAESTPGAEFMHRAESTHGAETYHAIDFQHFCVFIYEKTLESLKKKGRIDDIERLRTEWEPEYQRLKSLVGTHEKSPTFGTDVQSSCHGRKLFSTLSGHIGVGDVTLEPGDLVCVFLGGRTPFIIRPVDEKYKFIGECYLHGIMHGEALEEGLKKRQLITLI